MVGKCQFLLYTSTAVATITYPLVVYLQRQERVYIVSCFLPFIDRKSLSGFYYNNLYQAYLGILTLFVFFAIDLLFVTLLFTGADYIDFLRSDIAELSAELLKVGKMRDEKKISAMFKDVLVKGQNVDESV